MVYKSQNVGMSSNILSEFANYTYEIAPLPPPSDYYLIDSNDYSRCFGAALSKLMLNNNKPMFEELENKLKSLDEKVSQFGQIPALQSKVASLAKEMETTIDSEKYVECENCGVLVSKHKTQTCASVKVKRDIFGSFVEEVPVLHHLCQHCDMKKFKKENKY